MWKKARQILAGCCFVGFAALFVDQSFDGTVAQALSFLAKLELVPQFLAEEWLSLCILLLVTLLLGRIYCSVLCPMGLLQDVLAHTVVRSAQRKKKKSLKALRLLILLLFAGALCFGFPFLQTLLEPYSWFGRIMTAIGQPLAMLWHNALAWLGQGSETFLLAPVEIHAEIHLTDLVALASLAVVWLLLLFFGTRSFCAYCPVGTVLGCLAAHACWKPRIDEQSCTRCGACARVCKTGALERGKVDATKCIACYNCLDVCTTGALHFVAAKKACEQAHPRKERRAFLLSLLGAVLPMAAYAKENKTAQALLQHQYKEPHSTTTPILPAGAQSLAHFQSRCIGCQLCCARCPAEVLQSTARAPLYLQPSMQFRYGYCAPDCVRCGEVCPTGAILPLRAAEKQRVRVGRAVFFAKRCIIVQDGLACTACTRICPSGAITLQGSQPALPVVDERKCLGCGACEYVCPARPKAAMEIDGLAAHESVAQAPSETK